MTGYAYFVERPRTAWDLFRPHLPERELAYEIKEKIRLKTIDFDNFSYDMLADRQFLEESTCVHTQKEPLNCLLVYCPRRDYALLITTKDAYVVWAAAIKHPCD